MAKTAKTTEPDQVLPVAKTAKTEREAKWEMFLERAEAQAAKYGAEQLKFFLDRKAKGEFDVIPDSFDNPDAL